MIKTFKYLIFTTNTCVKRRRQISQKIFIITKLCLTQVGMLNILSFTNETFEVISHKNVASLETRQIM